MTIRNASSASPSTAWPGPASSSGSRRRSGRWARGAHDFRKAICTPAVESTPTAVLYADGKQVDQVGCSLSRWQDFETALAAAECELECLLSAADADAIAEFDV